MDGTELQKYFQTHNKSKEQKAHSSKVSFNMEPLKPALYEDFLSVF